MHVYNHRYANLCFCFWCQLDYGTRKAFEILLHVAWKFCVWSSHARAQHNLQWSQHKWKNYKEIYGVHRFAYMHKLGNKYDHILTLMQESVPKHEKSIQFWCFRRPTQLCVVCVIICYSLAHWKIWKRLVQVLDDWLEFISTFGTERVYRAPKVCCS